VKSSHIVMTNFHFMGGATIAKVAVVFCTLLAPRRRLSSVVAYHVSGSGGLLHRGVWRAKLSELPAAFPVATEGTKISILFVFDD
jgi:hypothetical protein